MIHEIITLIDIQHGNHESSIIPYVLFVATQAKKLNGERLLGCFHHVSSVVSLFQS